MSLQFVEATSTSRAVALVDASGSVSCSCRFALPDGAPAKDIFEKFNMVLKGLPHDTFRVMFWSSKGSLSGDGTMKFPFDVKRESMSQPFKVVRDKGNFGGTYAALALTNIDDWIEQGMNCLYLLTDGDISDQQAFSTAVSGLVSKHPDVQLNLITVQDRDIDFSREETERTMVGSDIYRILVQNGQTDLLASFTAFTLNHPDGYKLFSRVRAPPGFLAFRNQLFRDSDMHLFFKHVMQLVHQLDKSNEDTMLQFIQDLTPAVARYVRDKTPAAQQLIVRNFASLFRNSVIEMDMAMFLLSGNCEAENTGRANLLTTVRNQLKSAYARASLMLRDGVAAATGMSTWASVPLATPDGPQVVLQGCREDVQHDVQVGHTLYRKGAAQVDGKLVGALPMPAELSATTQGAVVMGGMREQCIRQWTREVLSGMYGAPTQDDIMVYLTMALHAWMVARCENAALVAGWRRLALVMLRKQRLNTTETEHERLERGETPTLNVAGAHAASLNDSSSFLAMLGRVQSRMGLPATDTPWQFWWALCKPLGLHNQLRHCVDVPKDYDYTGWPQLVTHTLPEAHWDYKCIITMNDSSATGGWCILEHSSLTQQTCRPRVVLSPEGYTQLLGAGDMCVCPFCYVGLTADSFGPVAPFQPTSGQDVHLTDDPLRKLAAPDVSTLPCKRSGAGRSGAGRSGTSTSCTKRSGTGRSGTKRSGASTSGAGAFNIPTSRKAQLSSATASASSVVVQLTGARGVGKSYFAAKLKEELEALGKTVCWVNVDKYFVQTGKACDAITAVSEQVCTDGPNSDVIILDPYYRGTSAFGLDLSACKQVQVNVNDMVDSEALALYGLFNVMERTCSMMDGALPQWLCPKVAKWKKECVCTAHNVCSGTVAASLSKAIKGCVSKVPSQALRSNAAAVEGELRASTQVQDTVSAVMSLL